MGLIVAFISGCIFALLLTGACLFASYRVIDFKENTDARREEKKRQATKRNIPVPSGGVIRPKTSAEMEIERNETTQALLEMINDPDKG